MSVRKSRWPENSGHNQRGPATSSGLTSRRKDDRADLGEQFRYDSYLAVSVPPFAVQIRMAPSIRMSSLTRRLLVNHIRKPARWTGQMSNCRRFSFFRRISCRRTHRLLVWIDCGCERHKNRQPVW